MPKILPAPTNFVEHRTRALANVFLTRRQDLLISELDTGTVDMLVQIVRDNEDGSESVFPFFCILLGTGDKLSTDASAAKYFNDWFRNLDHRPIYWMPVVVLVFSMQDDKGYFGWYDFPNFDHGDPTMHRSGHRACNAINERSLDVIVNCVTNWYESLSRRVGKNGNAR